MATTYVRVLAQHQLPLAEPLALGGLARADHGVHLRPRARPSQLDLQVALYLEHQLLDRDLPGVLAVVVAGPVLAEAQADLRVGLGGPLVAAELVQCQRHRVPPVLVDGCGCRKWGQRLNRA